MECRMNSYRFLSLTGLTLILFAGSASADSWDKRTKLDVSESVSIGGVTLAPGHQYTMERVLLLGGCCAVRVFDDHLLVVTTVLGLPAYRETPNSEPDLQWAEAPTGLPRPLGKWFWPGDLQGVEFVNRSREVTRSGSRYLIPRFGIDPTLDAPGEHVFRRKFALAVGVGNTKDPVLRLRFAGRDAKEMAAILADPAIGEFTGNAGDVTLLPDELASKAKIEHELEKIGSEAGPRDLVVVFYSAHVVEGLASGVRYLTAYDTDRGNLLETAFDLQTFVRTVERLVPYPRLLIIVDACSADSSVNALSPYGRTTVFWAAGSEEKSYEAGVLGTSVFMFFVSKELRQNGRTDDFFNIADRVTQQVRMTVEKQPKIRAHENPHLEGNRTASIKLGTITREGSVWSRKY